MTTSTPSRVTRAPLTFEFHGTAPRGKQGIVATEVSATDGEHSWTFYRTATDEWWRDCEECFDGPPEHGVCIRCGGVAICRLGGTKAGLLRYVREEINRASRTPNAVERAALRAADAVAQWNVTHPNLASDLAAERAQRALGNNPLGEIALAAVRKPLTAKQERYAILILIERAWAEAYARSYVHIGQIEEMVTVTGQITVLHTLVPDRINRVQQTLVVLIASDEDGNIVPVRTYTSAEWLQHVRVGDVVTLRGRVSQHDKTQYGIQTEIVRPARLV